MQAKYNVVKVLMSLKGIHDPTVKCKNARGLIDSLVLNWLFKLIRKLRSRYIEDDQSQCINVAPLNSVCL